MNFHYAQRDPIFLVFVQGSPITSGDICPSFATSFIAFVVCIVKRLWASNKHLSKIKLKAVIPPSTSSPRRSSTGQGPDRRLVLFCGCISAKALVHGREIREVHLIEKAHIRRLMCILDRKLPFRPLLSATGPQWVGARQRQQQAQGLQNSVGSEGAHRECCFGQTNNLSSEAWIFILERWFIHKCLQYGFITQQRMANTKAIYHHGNWESLHKIH